MNEISELDKKRIEHSKLEKSLREAQVFIQQVSKRITSLLNDIDKMENEEKINLNLNKERVENGKSINKR